MTDAIVRPITEPVREPLPEMWCVQFVVKPADLQSCYMPVFTTEDAAQDYCNERPNSALRPIRIPREGEPCPIEALRACVELLKKIDKSRVLPCVIAGMDQTINLAEAVPGVKK